MYVRENPDVEIEFCPALHSRKLAAHTLADVYNAADNHGPEDSLRFQWPDRLTHTFRVLLLGAAVLFNALVGVSNDPGWFEFST